MANILRQDKNIRFAECNTSQEIADWLNSIRTTVMDFEDRLKKLEFAEFSGAASLPEKMNKKTEKKAKKGV